MALAPSPTTAEREIYSLACTTCFIAFSDLNSFRQHFQTDWHCVNSKRKFQGLGALTFQEYEVVLVEKKEPAPLTKQDKQIYCRACRKLISNQKAFENHVKSKKHQQNEKARLDDSEGEENASEPPADDVEEVDSDEWDDEGENPLDNNDCIFCLHHSRNFIKNLNHMTIAHSFFIQDVEYCVDVVGLLRYLAEKVAEGFMCLWCNEKGRTFHSAEAARMHMLDKGHCKMLFEGTALAEYTDFYDYSQSYPDADKDVDADEEVTVPQLDDCEYQLTLPSGITVGHRSLMRYYKQSIVRSAVVPVTSGTKKLHKVLAGYRALGWTATQQEEASRRAKDLHHLKRLQSKLKMKLGVKGNSILQKHFRRQVNF